MSLLLAAITTPPTSELDRRLARVEVGRLTAWATQRMSGSDEFTREDMLAHHRLVGEVFAHVDACLPARFPTLIEDEAALARHLETRQMEFVERLQTVRGACELALTAVWISAPRPAANLDALTPGRRYMEERRVDEHRRAQATHLAATLEAQAGSGLRDSVRRVAPSSDVALSLALLVERSGAEDLKQRLTTQVLKDVRILVNGPWPPYTFVDRRAQSAST